MSRTARWAWAGGWLVVVAAVAAWASRDLSVWLEALEARGVEFAHPHLLWLALTAFLVPALAPASLTDLPRPQQFVQASIRMLLVWTLVAAAAGPRTLGDSPLQPQVIHLIDRSESMPRPWLEAARQGVVDSARWANRAEAAPLRQERPLPISVVAFDGRAVALPSASTRSQAEAEAPSLAKLTQPSSSRGETHLAAALNLALGMVGGSGQPHFVVWSDGIQTRGDAASTIPSLVAAGVRVHLPALPEVETQAEVVVEAFSLPARVRANVPFAVALEVRTTAPASVRCQLAAPGAEAPAASVHALTTGNNRIDLGMLRLRQAGAIEVNAECQVVSGSDRFASNNQLRTRVLVHEPPKILYVEGAQAQAKYLARALADDFEVEVRAADGLPRSLSALLAYQAIILSDVPRVSQAGVPLVTDGDMRNLHAFVEKGRGLLVLGGEDSLGSGGYGETYLDRHVLPVRMDVESSVQMPSVAMMLCIDRSGSMAGSKMELAKEAAQATAEALAQEDRIGVISFDSEARTAVRLQRAGNRYRIATDIARLAPAGGTHIYPALDQAFVALSSVQAKVKHVILLTDGQAPRAGIDPLVRQMRRSGVTVSAVGVGADVDRSLLEAIADRGGGRAYFTDRAETLPRIFVRETKLVAGESVVEQHVRARRAPGVGRIDLLRGVSIETAPPLTGFLPTRTKPGADEILRTSTGQPLLVRWRRGLGKVAVFTSDLKNRWAASWLSWPGYAVFVRQLVRDLQQDDLGVEATVQLLREGDQLRISVDAMDDDESWLEGLVGSADVRMADGQSRSVALTEVAAGRYEASVDMVGVGAYDVYAKLRAGPDKPTMASGRATIVHPYPDEHRVGGDSGEVLGALATATGGSIGQGPSAWFDDGGRTVRTWQWRWPDLARWALCLLLLDIGLRRVRLGRARARSWWKVIHPGSRSSG